MAQHNDEVKPVGDIEAMRRQVEAAIEREREQFVSEPDVSAHARFTSEETLRAAKNNEDGDGWLFRLLFAGRLSFDHTSRRWHQFQSHSWCECLVNEQTALVEEVIAIYAAEAGKQAWLRLKAAKDRDKDAEATAEANEKLLFGAVSKLQKLQRKRAVLELAAAGVDSLGVTGGEWDRDPWLLGCNNGVIDLRSGKLRAGRPEEYVKTVAPHLFPGLATKARGWEAFLFEIFDGNRNLVDYLQRLLGYAITGLHDEHVLPIFWGAGRNGKGTLLETISHVLGSLAGPMKTEMLLDQGRVRSSAAPDADIMSLRGKRLVWASETSEGAKIDAGKIKWLTGGDTLVGREPYGRREVRFEPTHTLFLLTNHKPKADPTDYAMWQRVHLVPFALAFVDNPTKSSERQRDPKLMDKLKAEAPEILAWLVRGCLLWQRHGLAQPDDVRVATDSYRQAEDLIGQFLAEVCVVGPTVQAQAGTLRTAYESWCLEQGFRPMSGNKFATYLLGRFGRDDTGRYRSYLGVGLKAQI
jgi:putative DNA primase/helicase